MSACVLEAPKDWPSRSASHAAAERLRAGLEGSLPQQSQAEIGGGGSPSYATFLAQQRGKVARNIRSLQGIYIDEQEAQERLTEL